MCEAASYPGQFALFELPEEALNRVRSSANFPDIELDRWRHIQIRRGRLETRLCARSMRENGRGRGRKYFADKFTSLIFIGETFSWMRRVAWRKTVPLNSTSKSLLEEAGAITHDPPPTHPRQLVNLTFFDFPWRFESSGVDCSILYVKIMFSHPNHLFIVSFSHPHICPEAEFKALSWLFSFQSLIGLYTRTSLLVIKPAKSIG